VCASHSFGMLYKTGQFFGWVASMDLLLLFYLVLCFTLLL